MQRDEAVFELGTVDLLTRAINQARRWAERKRNFELCRVQTKLTAVNLQDGASLSTAVLASDGVTTVNIKSIAKAFLPFSNGSGMFPVDVISRDAHVRRLQKRYENIQAADPTTRVPPIPSTVSYFTVVRTADKLYVTPADATVFGATTVDVYLDAFKWLPEYMCDADTDFFLDYCEDWLLFRSVYQLNMMLKEDVRVPISREALVEAWQSVIEWDTNLVQNYMEDANLD